MQSMEWCSLGERLWLSSPCIEDVLCYSFLMDPMRYDGIRVMSLATLCYLSTTSLSLGEDRISIGTLVRHATSFSQHLVSFQGKVKELGQLLPFPTRGCLAHERYKVVIEDETGSVDSIVCGNPIVDGTALAVGDPVRMSAVISIVGVEAQQSSILAIAKTIVRIDSPQD